MISNQSITHIHEKLGEKDFELIDESKFPSNIKKNIIYFFNYGKAGDIS